jgi:hybrid cluster-associated redox disulfide protein
MTEPQETPPPPQPVTRTSRISDVLDTRPDAGRVLREVFGLPCEECVVSESETLEEGARYYGHDVDEMVRRLDQCPVAPPAPTAEGGT